LVVEELFHEAGSSGIYRRSVQVIVDNWRRSAILMRIIQRVPESTWGRSTADNLPLAGLTPMLNQRAIWVITVMEV